MSKEVVYNPKKKRITFFKNGKAFGGMIGKIAVKKAQSIGLIKKGKDVR
jgi:hypothetical protein